VAGILMDYYQFDLGILFQPTWLSVIASLVLAILTAVYVLQTQGMLREMTETRKAEFLPHVKAGLKYPAPMAVYLRIENVGKGAAVNVNVTYGLQPSSEPFKRWVYPLFSPEESYSFLLQPSDFNKLIKQYDFLVVRGTCEDVFGQKHEINEKIDLKETHKGWSESMMIMESSLEDRLREVSGEVKEVGRAIRYTTRDRRTFPALVKLGSFEIRQPPLRSVDIYGDGIEFHGMTLDNKFITQLKKLREGDVEEIYCNDRHGVIFSEVQKIEKIELQKKKVGRKTVHSFRVKLKYVE